MADLALDITYAWIIITLFNKTGVNQMSHAKKDLFIFHDCQDLLERAIRNVEPDIRAKLLQLSTEDGKALADEFEQTLRDHSSDLMGDTLDAWAVNKSNEIEDETGETVPRTSMLGKVL
jgi:hypothetical protein